MKKSICPGHAIEKQIFIQFVMYLFLQALWSCVKQNHTVFFNTGTLTLSLLCHQFGDYCSLIHQQYQCERLWWNSSTSLIQSEVNVKIVTILPLFWGHCIFCQTNLIGQYLVWSCHTFAWLIVAKRNCFLCNNLIKLSVKSVVLAVSYTTHFDSKVHEQALRTEQN